MNGRKTFLTLSRTHSSLRELQGKTNMGSSRRSWGQLTPAFAVLLLLVIALFPSLSETAEAPSGAQPATRTPDHARAQRLLYSGQIAKAAAAWEEGLRKDSDDFEMLAALGATLYADRQFRRAVPYLQRAVGLKPEDWTLRLFFATTLHFAGERTQAQTEFQAIAKSAPNRGTVQIASDKLTGSYWLEETKAEQNVWAKLGTKRESSQSWIGEFVQLDWANRDSQLHDDGSLQPIFRASVFSRSWSAVKMMGDSMDLFGRAHFQAVSYAKNRYLITLRPWSGSPNEQDVRDLVNQLQWNFEFFLVHVRTGSPNDSLLQKIQALSAHAKGSYADAVEFAKAALRSAPDDPQAHSQLARAYAFLGQLDAAMNEQNVALTRWPDYAEGHFWLGSIQVRTRPRDAVVELTRAIEQKPTLWEAYVQLARAYLALGETKLASLVVAQASEAAPYLAIPGDIKL